MKPPHTLSANKEEAGFEPATLEVRGKRADRDVFNPDPTRHFVSDIYFRKTYHKQNRTNANPCKPTVATSCRKKTPPKNKHTELHLISSLVYLHSS